MKLPSLVAYFESACASACETIQVPHMHIIAVIEAVLITDPFGYEKAGL